MTKYFEDLLYNTDIDLSLSEISKDGSSSFVVKSKLSGPRIAFGLLFGIPCLVLIYYALRQQGIYFIFALVFCPPLGILGVLFGLTKQQKTFIPSLGKAIKSFQYLNIQRDREVQLPKKGVLLTYKKWSSGGETGGACYFYHVELQGLKGLGFCIANEEKKRDAFAKNLADFLQYDIRDQGERIKTNLSQ
jgi:hypothetical protein